MLDSLDEPSDNYQMDKVMREITEELLQDCHLKLNMAKQEIVVYKKLIRHILKAMQPMENDTDSPDAKIFLTMLQKNLKEDNAKDVLDLFNLRQHEAYEDTACNIPFPEILKAFASLGECFTIYIKELPSPWKHCLFVILFVTILFIIASTTGVRIELPFLKINAEPAIRYIHDCFSS